MANPYSIPKSEPVEKPGFVVKPVGLVRKISLLFVDLWLLWLGLMILIVQFNKYGLADPPIPDCDSSAEPKPKLRLPSWLG